MSRVPRHLATAAPGGRGRRLVASLAGAALLFGSATTAAMAAVSEATNATADESLDSQVADPTLGTPEVADETIETGEGESEEPSGSVGGDEGEGAGEGEGDAGDATDLEGTTDLEGATAGRPSGGDAEVDTEGLDEAMTLEATDAEIGTRAATTITVRAGGIRTGLTNSTNGAGSQPTTPGAANTGYGIGGLEGVTFGIYASQTAPNPAGTAAQGLQCTTDSDGTCTLHPDSTYAGGRPWVGVVSAPEGWSKISKLYAGSDHGTGNQKLWDYRYQVAPLGTTPTQTVPTWNPYVPDAYLTGGTNGWGETWPNLTRANFWNYGTSGSGTGYSPDQLDGRRKLFYQTSTARVASVRDNPELPFWSESSDSIECRPSVNVAVMMDLSSSTYSTAPGGKDDKTRYKYQDAVNGLIDSLSTDANGQPRDNVNMALFNFGTNSPMDDRPGYAPNYPTPLKLDAAGVDEMKTRVENYRKSVLQFPANAAALGAVNVGGNNWMVPSENGRGPAYRWTGATNWDQAFWALDEASRTNHYDIVLFITDGDPTTWGWGDKPGNGYSAGQWPNTNPFINAVNPSFRNLEFGAYSANRLKNSGVRVNVVGVSGTANALPDSNLAAISGPNKLGVGGITSLADADFTSPSWDDLGKQLQKWSEDVVPKPCDAWVTVQKKTKAFDQTDYSPADGWTFDLQAATLETTSITPSSVTGVTASLDGEPAGSFTWKFTFDNTNESAQALILREAAAPDGDSLDNWDLTQVVCSVERPGVDEDGEPITVTDDVPVTLAGLRAGLGEYQLTVGDHVTCKFSNEQAGVQMNKYWTVNGTDYPVNQMPTALGTTWNATPTLTPAPTKPDATVAWGKAMGVYKTGDKVQVGETSVTEVAENLPGCKLTKSEIKGPGIGTGTAYVDLPLTSGTGSAEGTLAAGLNVYDLHNVVTCEQELTLIKQVDNVEGGVAKPVSAPADWTLTAAGPTDGVTGTTGDEAITGKSVAVGSYALSEAFDADAAADGTAYQQQAQWACVTTDANGDTASKPVTGTMPAASVNVGIGEHVTCTVVNETAELTVLKKVVGGKAQPSDWTLTATPETDALAKIEAPGALQPLGTGEGKNTILVKPGETYILAENEGSAAYFQTAFQKYVASESCSLTEINQDNDACWTDADPEDVSVDALDRGIYRFVNTYVESPTLPQTGGQGAAFFAILGGGLLLGAGGLAALSRRRRVQA